MSGPKKIGARAAKNQHANETSLRYWIAQTTIALEQIRTGTDAERVTGLVAIRRAVDQLGIAEQQERFSRLIAAHDPFGPARAS